MKQALLLLSVFVATQLSAQFNTYYVGHSLINLKTPWMVKQLRIAAGTTTQYRHHINNGAPLHWQWNNPASFNSDLIWNPSLLQDEEHGTNFLTALANGASPAYKRMIITESIPITNNPNDTTGKYGKYFHDLAKNHDGTIKNFMLQTWEDMDDYSSIAAWRASIATLLPNWEAKVDKINTPSTSNNMYIIPAGLAMGALYDTLQIHSIGAMTNIQYIFSSDGIHLTDDGNYFLSCVMYACLYNASPIGLPAVTIGPYNNNTVINDPTIRAKLQQIAWVVASNYPRSGFPPLAVSDLNCFTVQQQQKSDNISIAFCLSKSAKLQQVSIEFSLDGVTFHELKTFHQIEGGQYNYSYQEQQQGNIYYRLRFSEESAVSYSNIVSVYIKNDEIKLSPNPADQVIWFENLDKNTTFTVYNSTGQIVLKSITENNRTDISTLNKGLYFIILEGIEKPYSLVKQ